MWRGNLHWRAQQSGHAAVVHCRRHHLHCRDGHGVQQLRMSGNEGRNQRRDGGLRRDVHLRRKGMHRCGKLRRRLSSGHRFLLRCDRNTSLLRLLQHELPERPGCRHRLHREPGGHEEVLQPHDHHPVRKHLAQAMRSRFAPVTLRAAAGSLRQSHRPLARRPRRERDWRGCARARRRARDVLRTVCGGRFGVAYAGVGGAAVRLFRRAGQRDGPVDAGGADCFGVRQERPAPRLGAAGPRRAVWRGSAASCAR